MMDSFFNDSASRLYLDSAELVSGLVDRIRIQQLITARRARRPALLSACLR